MRRFHFAFVSNSDEIGETLLCCSEPATEEVSIHRATMEEALPVARSLLINGVDVVIGSGGTGNLLAREIGPRVVKLNRSPFDLLQALMKAKQIGRNIALTNFADPIEGIELYEQLVEINISQIVFSKGSELEAGIAESVRRGYRVIVGGAACCRIAESHGAGGVVILPHKANFIQALKEARAITRAQREQRQAIEEVTSVLHVVRDGVIAVSAAGKLKLMNETAWDIVRTVLPATQMNALIDQRLPPALNAIGTTRVLHTGLAEADKITRLGHVDLVVSSFPIFVEGEGVGAVSIFREASKIHRLDRRLKDRFHRKGFVAKYTFDDIAHRSDNMKALLNRAKLYAASDATVLIEGETGTGKELLAQGIHNASRRAGESFVAVNCSALPDSLLESELFGYEEGAFTGALRGGKIGLFELADSGTLFLDEIADITPAMQVRLLRAIEEKEIMRVGGDAIIPVDVRIITASQRDLYQDSLRGKFRPDLYFRLSTLTLRVPPLRERLDDLPTILAALLEKVGIRQSKIRRDLITALKTYRWPGNVRELDSLLKTFTTITARGPFDEALFMTLFAEMQQARDWVETELGVSHPARDISLKDQLRHYEKHIIETTLAECRYNKTKAARRLGISVNSLWRKEKVARSIANP